MQSPVHLTDPPADDIARAFAKLTSPSPRKMDLARQIALFSYKEERNKTAGVESRAFNLMQFAKVGLTIIAGIAGLISNTSIHDTPFRESLILLLAIASAYLVKLFYRGARIVRVGAGNKPHADDHIKPDENDVFATQEDGEYLTALKTHVAKLVAYTQHTSGWNGERIKQLDCCYVNTIGFLISFFLFFLLSLVHLFQPDATFALPEHRLIGAALFALALGADWIFAKGKNRPG